MKREIQDEHVTHDQVVMSLRTLPRRVPPAGLTTSLRVIASRERQRLVENRSVGQIFVSWLGRSGDSTRAYGELLQQRAR